MRTNELRANGVCGFSQIAKGSARFLRDPLRQRQQARGLPMVRGRIAEQHGLALASHEGTDDGQSLVVRLAGRSRCSNTLFLRHGCGHIGHGLRPVSRPNY